LLLILILILILIPPPLLRAAAAAAAAVEPSPQDNDRAFFTAVLAESERRETEARQSLRERGLMAFEDNYSRRMAVEDRRRARDESTRGKRGGGGGGGGARRARRNGSTRSKARGGSKERDAQQQRHATATGPNAHSLTLLDPDEISEVNAHRQLSMHDQTQQEQEQQHELQEGGANADGSGGAAGDGDHHQDDARSGPVTPEPASASTVHALDHLGVTPRPKHYIPPSLHDPLAPLRDRQRRMRLAGTSTAASSSSSLSSSTPRSKTGAHNASAAFTPAGTSSSATKTPRGDPRLAREFREAQALLERIEGEQRRRRRRVTRVANGGPVSPRMTKADAVVEDFRKRDREEKETRRWLLEERIREQRRMIKEMESGSRSGGGTHSAAGSHGGTSVAGHHHQQNQNSYQQQQQQQQQQQLNAEGEYAARVTVNGATYRQQPPRESARGSVSSPRRGKLAGNKGGGKGSRQPSTPSHGIARITSPAFSSHSPERSQYKFRRDGSFKNVPSTTPRRPGQAARALMVEPQPHKFNSKIGQPDV
jgi:hypothetical protein